jgi:hypothetical protein
MRRSGTAWPWVLLLFGSACGDRVVVARGASLVSAAESEASDAGRWDAGGHEEHHFESGHGGTSGNHHPLLNSSGSHAESESHGAGGSNNNHH